MLPSRNGNLMLCTQKQGWSLKEAVSKMPSLLFEFGEWPGSHMDRDQSAVFTYLFFHSVSQQIHVNVCS